MAPLLVCATGGGSPRKDYRLAVRIILRAVLDDRSIEDKLQQHLLELRDLRVGLDTTRDASSQGNRIPGAKGKRCQRDEGGRGEW